MQENYFNQMFQSPLPQVKVDINAASCNLDKFHSEQQRCNLTQLEQNTQVQNFGLYTQKNFGSNECESGQFSNKMESLNTALTSDDGGTSFQSTMNQEQLSVRHLTAKSSGIALDSDDNNSARTIIQPHTDEDTKATSEEDSPQPQRSGNYFKKEEQEEANSQMMMQQIINPTTLDFDTTSQDIGQIQDSNQEEKKEESQEYESLIKLTQCKTGKVSKEDYTLIQVIGTGSYGKVLLVKKKTNGNLYAMKILKKKQIRKQKQVKNTWTERKILEKIDHPFIVKMNSAFQTEKKLFFVLDYCPGGELFFYISQIGRFKEQSAKFYAANILLALECLHENGIIYRDLKPENILIDKDGFAKLTDFGLSKDNFMGDQLANSFCGTAEYLAPEVLNKKGYSYSCDWWSFGCVVYEMLSAIPPFYSKKRAEIYDKIKFKNPNFYHYHSATATDLISKLLDKDPSKRLGYQSDAQEIKEHPFFADVDWDKMMLKQLATPYKPILEGKDDTKHFDQDICNMPIDSPVEDSFGNQQSDCRSSNLNDDFEGFSFVAETLLSSPNYQQQNNLNLQFNININQTQ
eukprot:403360851